jgi:predicted Zn finger-like uncharacterized protein
MKVKCPKCETSYKIDDLKIPPNGTHVKCTKCQTRFFLKKESTTHIDTSKREQPVCPKCGSQRLPGDKTCYKCGVIYQKYESYMEKKIIDETRKPHGTKDVIEEDSNKKAVVEQPVCEICQKKPPDPDYAFPLCHACRELLINRPFPNWIKIVMVIVGILLLYSVLKFPIAFTAGLAEKSAKKAESISDFSSAISAYQKVLALFPESEEHKARLAICYIKTGEIGQAQVILERIDDKKLSQNVVKELNALINELE